MDLNGFEWISIFVKTHSYKTHSRGGPKMPMWIQARQTEVMVRPCSETGAAAVHTMSDKQGCKAPGLGANLEEASELLIHLSPFKFSQ